MCARRAAEVFPNAEVAVQPGAGRSPWVDGPRRFAGRVADFLAAIGKGAWSVPARPARGGSRPRRATPGNAAAGRRKGPPSCGLSAPGADR
ncbi:hypothetical protein GCM10020295_07040 [Streptomyces cinereospinus]